MTKLIPKVFLHGFLGHPQDWEELVGHSPNHIFYNLWDDLDIISSQGDAFKEWVDIFLQKIPPSCELYAYSMGGRLALHAAIKNPSQFTKACFFSTHTGLKTTEERITRKKQDNLWIEKIHSSSWHEFIKEWQNQGVFRRDNKKDYFFNNPILAAKALDVWSLAKQQDLSEELFKLPKNSFFVAGESDSKFVNLLPKNTQNFILEKSGHRIPWNYPVSKNQAWSWLYSQDSALPNHK